MVGRPLRGALDLNVAKGVCLYARSEGFWVEGGQDWGGEQGGERERRIDQNMGVSNSPFLVRKEKEL